MDGLDVEGPEGPGELGQLSLVIRVIHPEDAVLVGVGGDRPAMLGQVSAQRLHVGLGSLGGCEAQGHQLAGGVIDEHDQGATLEPVMGLSRRSAPARPDTGGVGAANECEPTCVPWASIAPRRSSTAQCLGRELVPVVGGQLLAGQRGTEVGIVGAD